jgi:hypothetical protein
MRIKRKDLKLLIESLLQEIVASPISDVDLTYTKDASGVYRAKKKSLDPYEYEIIYPKSKDGKQIVVKVLKAPPGRSSAVGQTFKITTKNMDNPNVQLLYSAVKVLDSANITPLTGDTDLVSGKFTATSGEYVDIGIAKPYIIKNILQEQFDQIIKVGKENADTVLKTPYGKLSSSIRAKLEDKSLTSLHSLANAISDAVELGLTSEVVSVIFYGDSGILYCDVMAKTGSLEYTILQGNTEAQSPKITYDEHVKIRKPPVGEVITITDKTTTPDSPLKVAIDKHVDPTPKVLTAPPDKSIPDKPPKKLKKVPTDYAFRKPIYLDDDDER